MTERQAKRQLRMMLETLTPGSVLHLLGDVFQAQANQAKQDGDVTLYRRCRMVENALFVVGMGLDATFPQ